MDNLLQRFQQIFSFSALQTFRIESLQLAQKLIQQCHSSNVELMIRKCFGGIIVNID